MTISVNGTPATPATLAQLVDDLNIDAASVSNAGGGTVQDKLTALAGSGGAALVGFSQPGAGAVLQDMQQKGRQLIDRRDYSTLQEAMNAAAASTRALYLGDEDFTVTSSITLPNTDISIIGPGSGAITITFTGAGGLFVASGLSSTTNIDIGGFRAVAGAANCGPVVDIAYTSSTGIDVRAVALHDIVAEFNNNAANWWSGGFKITNARNSVIENCYVHGQTGDLTRTAYGFQIRGEATDVKLSDCQAVSVGTAVDIGGTAEGTLLTNFVAVDVNIGVSKVHSGGSEPWLSMAGWHINCRQKGFVFTNVLQTTITNGLLYCQNGTGAWIGIHITNPSVASQDIQIDALIDAQLAGGGVSSTTGIQIDGGIGISAKLKLRGLSVGANIAAGVTNSVLQLEPNAVTALITGAGAYAATNRIVMNLPGQGYGLPATSGPFNPDDSATASKAANAYGFGRDTTGAVKAAGGVRMVSQDSNWVNAQTEVMARRGDALVQGIVLFGTGSPEGVVSAPVGALYTRNDGGVSTTLYVKTSGTGNTGWTAK